MAVSPATPEYLKWTKVHITFDHSDHSNIVPKPGRYPLIVSLSSRMSSSIESSSMEAAP
jgi:hypothetical protein